MLPPTIKWVGVRAERTRSPGRQVARQVAAPASKFSPLQSEMAKNATRKNVARKNRKGAAKAGTKKRKLSPALKAWNEKVMKVFREKRKTNPNYKLMDAMRDAKKAH